MQLFDTHAHFSELLSLEALVKNARQAGVHNILAVGGSKEMNNMALEAAKQFPDEIKAALGYDRDQTSKIKDLDSTIEELEETITNNQEHIAAIGEIGIDLHYSPETKKEQIKLFSKQLELARKLNLPAIIHSRDAEKETFKELKAHSKRCDDKSKVGVLHCFTGSQKFAKKLLKRGFYISFSGIITFKTASDIRDVAETIPDDRLLIETDSPYLAPIPHRGNNNEPAYVKHVAEKLAETKGYTLEEIAELTTQNAKRLFNIP